jgi:hypothetical protein
MGCCIVNFFICVGGTAGGVDVSTLSASDIMGAGVQLAGHMLKAAAATAAAGAQRTRFPCLSAE